MPASGHVYPPVEDGDPYEAIAKEKIATVGRQNGRSTPVTRGNQPAHIQSTSAIGNAQSNDDSV